MARTPYWLNVTHDNDLSRMTSLLAPTTGMRSRARGCLLGQLAGDSLGSLVEFETEASILRRYPQGVRDLTDGGTWNTLAGQPTDDSELALTLARSLVDRRHFEAETMLAAYRFWLESHPFDVGTTTSVGLRGSPNPESQANGALMRISPLGIFGARHPLADVAEWAMQDARLTHPHPICVQANALFATTLADAIASGSSGAVVHVRMRQRALDLRVEPGLLAVIDRACDAPPADYQSQQGWVLIAFQNAFWQLLHAPSAEAAIVDTVGRGGDTDTNAAICGALVGAVYGIEAIPQRWIEAVLSCRPSADNPHARQPRPECFWPVDALHLADRLLGAA